MDLNHGKITNKIKAECNDTYGTKKVMQGLSLDDSLFQLDFFTLLGREEETEKKIFFRNVLSKRRPEKNECFSH